MGQIAEKAISMATLGFGSGLITRAGVFFTEGQPEAPLKCQFVQSSMLSTYNGYIQKVAREIEARKQQNDVVCVSSDAYMSKLKGEVWYSCIFYR